MRVKPHVRVRNLGSASENITSELPEAHGLAAEQHCYLRVQPTAAVWLDRECKVLWPPLQGLPLLPESTRCPRLRAYPQYGDFTLRTVDRMKRAKTEPKAER